MSLLDGLISWWDLDELKGTRYDRHIGNHLTDNNTVGSTPGLRGDAALFTASNSEYLSGASPGFGAGSFSVSAWIKTATEGYYTLVSTGGTASQGFLLYYRNGSDVRFHVGDGVSNVFKGVPGPDVDTWTHYLFTVDREAGLIRGYRNGVEHTTPVALPEGFGSVDSLPVHLGRRADTSGYYLNGALDEVGLWHRVLTPEDVAELYNDGAGVSYNDIVPHINPATLPSVRIDLDPHAASWQDEAGTIPAGIGDLVARVDDQLGANPVTMSVPNNRPTLDVDAVGWRRLRHDGANWLNNSTFLPSANGEQPFTGILVYHAEAIPSNQIIVSPGASKQLLNVRTTDYQVNFGSNLRTGHEGDGRGQTDIAIVEVDGAQSRLFINARLVGSGDAGTDAWPQGISWGANSSGANPLSGWNYRAIVLEGTVDKATVDGIYAYLRNLYRNPPEVGDGGQEPVNIELQTGQAVVSGEILDITEGTPPVVPQLAGVTAIALEFESANPALDATGHTTPVEVNDVLVNESGFIGASALFTGGARRHFAIPDGPYSRNGDRSWTYAFMLNPHNLSNRPYLLCKPFDEDDFELAIRLQSTGVMLAQVGNGVERQYHETVATVPIDSWTGVFVGFDDVNRVLEISFNNAEPESWDITVPTGIAPTDLVIGLKDPTSLNFNLNGEIDQLFKFDKFLTPEDKAWIWNNGNWRTAAEVLSTGGGQNVILSTGVTNASGFLLDLTEGQIRSLSLAIANLTGENVNVVEGVIRTLSLGQADTHGEFLGIRQGESRVIQTGFISPQGELINISLGSQERILNIGIASALGELLKVQDTAQGRRLSTGQAKSEGFELSISTGQIRSLSFAIAQATGQPLEVVQAQVRNLVLGSANATGQSLAVQLASNTITLSTGSVGVPGDDLEFTLGQLITLSTGIAVSTGLPLHVAAIRILSMGEARSMGYTLHIGERFIPSSIGVRHRMSRIYTSVHNRKPITVRFRNG